MANIVSKFDLRGGQGQLTLSSNVFPERLAYPTLNQGLVALYRFDERFGFGALDSAGGNDGLITGARHVQGVSGTGLEFNGTSDYVDVPDPVYDPSDTEYSYTAWFRWDGGGGGTDGRRFILESKPGYGMSLAVQSGASPSQLRAFVQYNGASDQSLFSTQSFNAGEIYFVVVTWKRNIANGLKIYINGVLDAELSGATADFPLATSTGLNIGTYRSNNNRWFDGLIDEVRIYNRVLTLEEIQALYNEPSGRIDDEAPMIDIGDLEFTFDAPGQLFFLGEETPTAQITSGVNEFTLFKDTKFGFNLYELLKRSTQQGIVWIEYEFTYLETTYSNSFWLGFNSINRDEKTRNVIIKPNNLMRFLGGTSLDFIFQEPSTEINFVRNIGGSDYNFIPAYHMIKFNLSRMLNTGFFADPDIDEDKYIIRSTSVRDSLSLGGGARNNSVINRELYRTTYSPTPADNDIDFYYLWKVDTITTPNNRSDFVKMAMLENAVFGVAFGKAFYVSKNIRGGEQNDLIIPISRSEAEEVTIEDSEQVINSYLTTALQADALSGSFHTEVKTATLQTGFFNNEPQKQVIFRPDRFTSAFWNAGASQIQDENNGNIEELLVRFGNDSYVNAGLTAGDRVSATLLRMDLVKPYNKFAFESGFDKEFRRFIYQPSAISYSLKEGKAQISGYPVGVKNFSAFAVLVQSRWESDQNIELDVQNEMDIRFRMTSLAPTSTIKQVISQWGDTSDRTFQVYFQNAILYLKIRWQDGTESTYESDSGIYGNSSGDYRWYRISFEKVFDDVTVRFYRNDNNDPITGQLDPVEWDEYGSDSESKASDINTTDTKIILFARRSDDGSSFIQPLAPAIDEGINVTNINIRNIVPNPASVDTSNFIIVGFEANSAPIIGTALQSVLDSDSGVLWNATTAGGIQRFFLPVEYNQTIS
jgi:hypothetical protein